MFAWLSGSSFGKKGIAFRVSSVRKLSIIRVEGGRWKLAGSKPGSKVNMPGRYQGIEID
jgi:hypothetical protein